MNTELLKKALKNLRTPTPKEVEQVEYEVELVNRATKLIEYFNSDIGRLLLEFAQQVQLHAFNLNAWAGDNIFVPKKNLLPLFKFNYHLGFSFGHREGFISDHLSIEEIIRRHKLIAYGNTPWWLTLNHLVECLRHWDTHILNPATTKTEKIDLIENLEIAIEDYINNHHLNQPS